MPERSAKMKRRIFGFHRRVWWPKWTPASSQSCSWGCAMRVCVSYLSSGLSVHRVHLRPRPPQGHPRAGSGGVRDGVILSPSLSLRVTRLPLAELEPLPGAWATRLLALDGARIARHEPGGPELGPVLPVRLHQRPRDPQPKRPGLARLPAPVHVRLHVERAERVGGGEALLDVLHQRRTREVVAQRAAVDVPLDGPGGEVHPGDARLAAAHGLPAECGGGHVVTFDGVTEN